MKPQIFKRVWLEQTRPASEVEEGDVEIINDEAVMVEPTLELTVVNKSIRIQDIRSIEEIPERWAKVYREYGLNDVVEIELEGGKTCIIVANFFELHNKVCSSIDRERMGLENS